MGATVPGRNAPIIAVAIAAVLDRDCLSDSDSHRDTTVAARSAVPDRWPARARMLLAALVTGQNSLNAILPSARVVLPFRAGRIARARSGEVV